MDRSGTSERSGVRFDDASSRFSTYLTFFLDITQEKKEKKLYLLIGSGLPTLARVQMVVWRYEGGESYTRLQCVVDEIEGVIVPEITRLEQIVQLETAGAPTEVQQIALLQQALARCNLVGRTVLADDVEGHLRVAALRRRLKRSSVCS